jgi:hypothetical protein
MSAHYQHCESDMCPPARLYMRHETACGCGCPRCLPVEPADRIATLHAELERARAEAAYLRAHRAWERAADRAAGWGSVAVIPDAWLAANPEPVPPPGVGGTGA